MTASKNEDLIQQLMDEFYTEWQNRDGVSRENLLDEYLSKSPKHVVAVRFGNMNYQVGNGGWMQWHDNEYSKDIEVLMDYCIRGYSLGHKIFKEIYQILMKVFDNIEAFEEELQELYDYENEYHDEDEDDYYDEDEPYKNFYHRLKPLDTKYYNLTNNAEVLWTGVIDIINNIDEIIDLNHWRHKISEIDNPAPVSTISEEEEKPRCKLVGTDGNAFAIMGTVSEALRKAGHANKINEFRDKATSGDYNHLLQVAMEYVEVY